jgi:hypothetical protein
MSATLATLRDRVEQILMDSGNAIWATDDIDEAIRQALSEYSKIRPLQAVTTLAISATTHELSISTVTGLIGVLRVWCPYTEAAPPSGNSPNWVAFEHWADLDILYFPDEVEAGDVARIFYDKVQALKDLDSAAATTFPDDDESLLATGAAGYAAMSRALDLSEQVTLDRDVPAKAKTWAGQKLQEFRQGLVRVARAEAQRGHSHVPLPPLDRHDSTWA